MRYLLVFALLTGAMAGVNACDICGCSSGGSYFGILPRFGKHFAGVRYQYRAFSSAHPAINGEQPASSREWYQTGEIWGRYVPHPRIQIFGFLPYHHFERQEDRSQSTVNAMGDAGLVANLIVLNTGDSLYNSWKQALQIGGGVKMPTGRHLIVQEGLLLNPNMQPGTGTWDFPLNAIYTIRRNRVGMNAELQYRINGTNKNRYRFGNKTIASAQVFYWQNLKRFSLLPQGGLSFESAGADRKNGIVQDYTGGEAVYATAGINMYYKRLALGMNVNQPVYQHLGDRNVQAFTAASAALTFLF